MTRAVKTGELFATFNYDGKDCADMGIYNVTSGSVYTMNIEPTFNDDKLEVPAYDGKYYYGTQITGQQFQFSCFAHDLTAIEYDRMRAWLNPRKIGRLILSDQPYKYYLVKPISVSTLGAYPLTTIQTPDYSIMGDYIDGDVVYTGSFSITFETVGSAYGYGMSYYRDDLIYDAKKKYGRDYYYNSGLLYRDMCPKANWDIEANVMAQEIPMYNPGSSEGRPTYTLEHEGKFTKNSFIQFNNETTGTSTVIDIGELTGNITIDTSSQTLTDSEGNVYYGRFSGTPMTLSALGDVIELPETWVENVEDTDLLEYDSFYIENNVVKLNPKILIVSEDLIGRYFCVNNNGGSKIVSIDVDNNELTLDDKTYTRDILPAVVDGTSVITPAGSLFRWIGLPQSDELPASGTEGDVCKVDGTCYTYTKNAGWVECNYFNGIEDFKNIYGDTIAVYKVFGATIVELDNLTIKTGTNINYKDNGTIKTGSSVGAFKLSAGLQPRYL
jgi:phage-related protein